MNVSELKSFLRQFFFSDKGKFRHGQLTKLPIELSEQIFKFTSNCESTSIKDRIFWILHDITDYKSCKNCGKKITKKIVNFSSRAHLTEYCTAKCRMSHKEFREKIRNERQERTGYEFPLQDPLVAKKVAATNLQKYGVQNVFQSNLIKEKIKAQSLRDHGTEFPSTTDAAKEKRKQTVLHRYGVENVAKVSDFQRKKKISNLLKYGVENVNQVEKFKEKAKATNLERYGCEYPSHTEKGIETSLQRYGVRHPMQHPPIFERVMKARFKFKSFTSKTGRVYEYQGYEDVMIRLLIEIGVDEDKIITARSEVPKIFYHKPQSSLISRYYPDIWIKDTKIIIEVKSEFTINQDPEITLKKQEACKENGFHCMIVVCNKHKVLNFFL